MHRQSDSKLTTPDHLIFGEVADFDRALRDYCLDNVLRPLDLETFDCSIKMYTTIDKAVRVYSLFTLARSQGRVPKTSTAEASRSLYKYTECELRTPDDEEMSRLWRGFLLYELVCLMHGVPHIFAAASNQSYHAPKELLDACDFVDAIPASNIEEIMCIQQYFREQYDLAFNEVVHGLELAVAGLNQRASDTSSPPGNETKPIFELEFNALRHRVQYLFSAPCPHSKRATTNLAMLGVSFLQRFLSWDATTRLDFIRTTFPFLGSRYECYIERVLEYEIDERRLAAEVFGWGGDHIIEKASWEKLKFLWEELAHLSDDRLRAVGWIFWKDPYRLSFMDLNGVLLYTNYGPRGVIRPRLRTLGPLHLMETSVDPQEWKRIVQRFGQASEGKLKGIKRCFTEICNLESASTAEVSSLLRCQHDGDTLVEAEASNDSVRESEEGRLEEDH